MNTKKMIGLVAMMASLTLLVGCGTPTQEIEDDQTTPISQEENTSAKDLDLTSKQCIELMAYAIKGTEYQAKGDYDMFMKRVQKTDALMQEYEMADENYESVCQSLVMEANVMEKIQKRVTELK